MKKILISIALLAVIVFLGFWLVSLFTVPMEFEKQIAQREGAVIQRLKDIRKAQRSFRSKNAKFAASFDELIAFVQNDSLEMIKAIGSEDDSVANARGLVSRIKYKIAVKDTLFPKGYDANNLRFVPFSKEATGELKQLKMDTASIVTESKVRVPVFEAFAPYAYFIKDLNHQEVINYRDYKTNTLGKDDGLKVGSLTTTNNEAGNWE